MSETSAQAVPGSEAPEPGAPDWRINAAFFGATLVTVFWAGQDWSTSPTSEKVDWMVRLVSGWTFAVPLLAILLCHEFGHYIAARVHRVPASLPYFIPLPIGFGTLGAIISMPARIRSRNALLDIGAAGPLAGIVVAIPIILYGISLSEVGPPPEGYYGMEGQSLLYLALKYLAVGPIPTGHDVALHPTAAAGWVGLLLTMLNLVPFGQLDGGHISYALLGPKSSTLSRVVRVAIVAWFMVQLTIEMLPVQLGTSHLKWWMALANAGPWLMWFAVMSVLKRLQGGYDHPPTDDDELSRGRRWVAWGCLLLFVLLFMPTPMATRWQGP